MNTQEIVDLIPVLSEGAMFYPAGKGIDDVYKELIPIAREYEHTWGKEFFSKVFFGGGRVPEYKAAAAFIKSRIDQDVNQHPFYTRYYMAQALFHSDLEAWKAWNQRTMEELQKMQKADGSISSPYGPAYGTGMSVLALALNYRLLPVYER